MQTHVSAKFEIDDWQESPFDEGVDGAKVTRAHVARRYSGDIEGASITEWLMAYADDGSASFVGMERISGTVDGKEGTLVLRHVGSYEEGAATGKLDVVSGTGTGDLHSARGTGEFVADPSGSVTLDLTFD